MSADYIENCRVYLDDGTIVDMPVDAFAQLSELLHKQATFRDDTLYCGKDLAGDDVIIRMQHVTCINKQSITGLRVLWDNALAMDREKKTHAGWEES